MTQLGGFPRHPERDDPVRVTVGQRPAHVMAVWAILVMAAGTAGITATVLTTPPDADGLILGSPLFWLSFVVLTVLCGVAGWFVPAWGLYWALVAFAPYLVGFWIQIARHPAPPEDADFSPLSFGFLLFCLLLPWGAGYAASAVRRN